MNIREKKDEKKKLYVFAWEKAVEQNMTGIEINFINVESAEREMI